MSDLTIIKSPLYLISIAVVISGFFFICYRFLSGEIGLFHYNAWPWWWSYPVCGQKGIDSDRYLAFEFIKYQLSFDLASVSETFLGLIPKTLNIIELANHIQAQFFVDTRNEIPRMSGSNYSIARPLFRPY